MIPADLEARAAALATEGGLGAVEAIEPLTGGANNRVFRLRTTTGVALLKAYFRHPDDPRDRLGAEFGFARLAWAIGVRRLPQPYACDVDAGLGLFEFVPGRLLTPTEVNDDAIDQALAFLAEVNGDRTRPEATRLALASEACFSLDAHLDCVGRRVERLRTLPVAGAIDRDAHDFVMGRLVPAWQAIEWDVRSQGKKAHVDAELPQGERILSPSDFGYHNALLAADGRLRFVDFEYSGWDDPAKLVCDFFCQPALPVPAAAFGRFARAVAELLPRPDVQVRRAELLRPVYRIKWCCIVLNEFLPVGSRRRQFSGSVSEQQERKVRQLDKARQALAALTADTISGRQVA